MSVVLRWCYWSSKPVGYSPEVAEPAGGKARLSIGCLGCWGWSPLPLTHRRPWSLPLPCQAHNWCRTEDLPFSHLPRCSMTGYHWDLLWVPSLDGRKDTKSFTSVQASCLCEDANRIGCFVLGTADVKLAEMDFDHKTTRELDPGQWMHPIILLTYPQCDSGY